MHRATLHDLPVEILGEIFIHSLPEDALSNLQPNFRSAPLLLCHVCSSWRKITFGMPRLWTDFCVRLEFRMRPPPYKDKAIVRICMDFLHWWIRKADPLPVSFKATQIEDQYTRFQESTLATFTKFSDFFAFRFIRVAQFLDLTPDSNHDLRDICVNSTPFENLECLALRGFRLGNAEFVGSSSSLHFPPSPKLRRLYIDCHGDFPRRAFHIVPWAQLTHLCNESAIRQEDFLLVLCACVNLRFGTFKIMERTRQRSDFRVDLPNLRYLIMTCGDLTHVPTPFEGLLFSGLKSLRIACGHDVAFIRPRVLEEFLVATPSLTELHLHNCVTFESRYGEAFPMSILNNPSPITIPLHDRLPHLKFLVLDSVTALTAQSAEKIIQFHQSQWLGAEKAETMVEIVLDLGWFYDGIVRRITDYLANSKDISCPLILREAREKKEWDNLESTDIRDRWEQKMRFYELSS